MDSDYVRGGQGPRERAGPWRYSAPTDDAAQSCQISIEILEEAKKLVLEVTSPNFKFLSAVVVIESIVLNWEIQTGHEHLSRVGKVGIGRDKRIREWPPVCCSPLPIYGELCEPSPWLFHRNATLLCGL